MTARRLFLTGVVLSALLAVPAALASPAAVVTGQDSGWPDVRGWTAAGAQAATLAPWGSFDVRFAPYPAYQQGVRVAIGDVTGDGKPEIVTAPGGGWFTEIHVFDGQTFARVAAYPPFGDGSAWQAGGFVAVGDTTGSGHGDVIVGLDHGCCTSIRVLQGASGIDRAGFYTYGNSSDVGVRVAAADVNGDGKAEILGTSLANSGVVDFYAPTGGMPFRSISAFPAGTAMTIAAGDVLGTPRPELVVAASTGDGVQVKVFDVQSGGLLASLSPLAAFYAPQIATANVNGDGRQDVVVSASSQSGTEVAAFDVATGKQLTSFFVLEPNIVPGASLAAGDLDGDGKAEIVLGGGPTIAPAPSTGNGPDQRVVVYHANGTRAGSFSAYDGLFQGGVRVGLGDVNRDGLPEVVTAPGPGTAPEIGVFSQNWSNSRDRGTRLAHFLAYEPGFRGGVNVAVGDVSGSGAAQIVTAPGPGRPGDVKIFGAAGSVLSTFRAFGDTYTGGVSVAAGDLDGDGRAEIVVGTLTGPPQVLVFHADGKPWPAPVINPFAGSERGVEVAVADLAGTGHGLVLAAQATGSDPLAVLIDPVSGAVTQALPPIPSSSGLRIAAGDVDGDGRDEIVYATGRNGGDGTVHALDAKMHDLVDWVPGGPGDGFNVAVAARIGLPIRSEARTVKVRARRPTGIIVARFVDAATARVSPVTAAIAWPDGRETAARVVRLDTQVFGVRLVRTYKRPGTFPVTVTLIDGGGRHSVAHSTIVVRRP